MRDAARFAVVTLALSLLIAAGVPVRASSGAVIGPNDASLIAVVRDLWQDAINDGNLVAATALYRPGAVVLPDGSPPQLGAIAIADWHGRWDSRAVVSYAVESDRLDLRGRWAYEEWTASVTLAPSGDASLVISDDPLQFVQQGVRVYRKDESGAWRIDREAWSEEPAATARYSAPEVLLGQ